MAALVVWVQAEKNQDVVTKESNSSQMEKNLPRRREGRKGKL
jgi:hypothetical protein